MKAIRTGGAASIYSELYREKRTETERQPSKWILTKCVFVLFAVTLSVQQEWYFILPSKFQHRLPLKSESHLEQKMYWRDQTQYTILIP